MHVLLSVYQYTIITIYHYTTDMCTHTCRYGVQVASALLVFILMWILLATLDDGLKDPKHFDPGTKHTFWVGVQASAWEC
jgi:hypothetical protein